MSIAISRTLAAAMALSLAACRDDTPPGPKDKPGMDQLIGSYFPDKATDEVVGKHMTEVRRTSRIVLRDDYTFHIENVPDWIGASSPDKTGALATRGGSWSLQQEGRNPWFLAIRYDAEGIKPDRLMLVGTKPPYDIHLGVGAPADGHTLRFQKRF